MILAQAWIVPAVFVALFTSMVGVVVSYLKALRKSFDKFSDDAEKSKKEARERAEADKKELKAELDKQTDAIYGEFSKQDDKITSMQVDMGRMQEQLLSIRMQEQLASTFRGQFKKE
jgi:hypothetical protein